MTLIGILGGLGVEAAELVELLIEMLGHGRGPLLGFGALAQLVGVLLGAIETQLVLQHLYLLAQEVVALLLVDVGVNLGVDFALDFEVLDFFQHQFQQLGAALHPIVGFEQLLLHAYLHIDVGGEEVG